MADTLGSAFSDATSSIPGYGVVQQVLLQNFGLEANALVSKYLILFAVYKFFAWFYEKAYHFLENHFTSSIEIDDYDDLFQQLRDWARTQPMTKVSREIRAVSNTSKTVHDHDWDDSDDEEDTEEDNDDYAIGPTGLFSFEAWNRKNPLKYYPNVTRDFFRYKGRYFQYRTSERRNVYGEGHDQLIIIRCLGRSTKPIKEFLEFVKGWTHEKQKVKPTHVYRTSTRSGGGGGGGTYWTRVAVRPSRPLSTVALDDAQKGMIVRDINEYLHPATARWYSARGIPHRRGYLFHGPPGTGKTSLSFSRAGLFGLSIYCVALSESGLTEATLGQLFSDLLERCIVLLEDIDSAGLRRNGGKSEEDLGQDEDSDSDKQGEEQAATSRSAALLQRLRTAKIASAQVNKSLSLISLAGLLNVIDGAASQEGRVLIMTSNYPEKLDPALVCPGRADLQIGFSLATRHQARDIFKRMYNTKLDAKKDKSKETKSPTSTASSTSENTPAISSEERAFLQRCLRAPPTSTSAQPAQLEELADKFASSIPTEVLSPAEIQGYLLQKTDPLSAVSEVDKWRDEHLEEKKKK